MASALKKICLIDGNAMLYQNYYGTLRSNLTNPKGIRINAVYGFLRKILGIINSEEYDGISVLWDHPSPTFRHVKYPAYKGNRSTTPEDLVPQFNIARQAVEACQLKQIEMPSFEADDIIATLSNKLSNENIYVEILTGDKDLLQLVNPYVICKRLQNGKIYNVATVVDEYGIYPEQIPELFALIGDTVDNLPGIPGIGKVRGKQLLQEYKSIDDIINICKNNDISELENMKYGKLLASVQNYITNDKNSSDPMSLEDAIEMNTLVQNINEIDNLNVDKIIEDCKYPKLAQNRDELKQVPLYDFLIEHDFKSML
jgi:5'-3' exonuclease